MYSIKRDPNPVWAPRPQPPGVSVHPVRRPDLPAHLANTVWWGDGGHVPSGKTVASGFAALDAVLPGGGWPTQGITELLLAQPGACEWRLLGPSLHALLHPSGRLYLVGSPHPPHTVGLAQMGAAVNQVVWCRASEPGARLWVVEQLLKADLTGAIVAWLPQARPAQIRRLQCHAQACRAAVFLVRPAAVAAHPSAACVRMLVSLSGLWGLEVRVLKCRGPTLPDSLHLQAIPPHLHALLPARLRRADAGRWGSITPEIADATGALGRRPAFARS